VYSLSRLVLDPSALARALADGSDAGGEGDYAPAVDLAELLDDLQIHDEGPDDEDDAPAAAPGMDM